MNFINSPLSQFEVTNLIEIFAPIFGQLNIILTNLAPQPWQFGFQDSAATFLGFGFGFYFKLFFVFFLIIVNIYLVLSHNKEEVNKVKFLQKKGKSAQVKIQTKNQMQSKNKRNTTVTKI